MSLTSCDNLNESSRLEVPLFNIELEKDVDPSVEQSDSIIPEVAKSILEELLQVQVYDKEDYSILFNEEFEYHASTILVEYDKNNQLVFYFENNASEGGDGFEYRWIREYASFGEGNISNIELFMPYTFTFGDVGFLKYNLGTSNYYFEVQEQDGKYSLHAVEQELMKEFENELLNLVNEVKENVTNFQISGKVLEYCPIKKMVDSEYGEIEISRCFKISKAYFETLK